MANAILNTFLGALITSAAVVGTTAQAFALGFTDSYAPEQWELFNSSPAFPGIDNSKITINGISLAPFNGSVDFADAPDSLTLLGSDQSAILDEFGLNCSNVQSNLLFLCQRSFTTVFVTVPEASVISFDWDYTTADPFGPAFDPFGFALGNFPPDSPAADGIFNELIDRRGQATQSGSQLVKVAANQVFGFQIGTADNREGRAQVTIRDFQVMVTEPDEVDPKSVPEPTSGIAIALLSGLGLRQKSRKDRP
ncbi:MAG: hypothetical protein AAGF93_06890 [Cyanobacteria bacterium P01_H01_bin.105]